MKKKWTHTVAALAMIMGLSTLDRPAQAAGFTDDFDAGVPGTFPAGWAVANKPGSSTEFATGGPNGIQEITASESRSAPQSLQLLADGSQNTAYNIVCRPFSRFTTGLVVVDFAVRLDAEPHNSSAAVFIDDQADTLMSASDPEHYGLYFTGDWHGRQIGWFDGTWHDLGGYDLNRWYDVKLTLDLDAKAFDISIDNGALLFEGALPTQPSLVNGVQRLVLFNDNGSGYSGSAWFDNISVVPEPATMSLLALGGLSLLRRRRDQ